jgi:hypothetical protein
MPNKRILKIINELNKLIREQFGDFRVYIYMVLKLKAIVIKTAI